MSFVDRADAGRRLAVLLRPLAGELPVVVGLPRGGVAVAYEVAVALEAPLDVVIVRKLGAPLQPELAVGAVGEGGVRVLNGELVERLDLGDDELDAMIRRETAEIARRVERLRGDAPPVPVTDRTVILVDDGIATGATARAAIALLRIRQARRVVLGVPVAPPSAVEQFRRLCDDVVCVVVPDQLWAVGEWYEDFDQLDDADVARLLTAARDRSRNRG